mmetsp:Transcript_27057/g.44141  ORF Transcript_27057/g.44141 Transcript_27057/m.44141 type:complete len:676 (-) Transcript_27057:390-2417(-)
MLQDDNESVNLAEELSVLVVEDDQSTRKIVQRFLTKLYRCSVTTVSSGTEALKLFEMGKRFDLVLSDVFMPGIDGLALVDTMKGTDNLKETPVIFMSVTKRVEVVNDCWRRGGMDFLSKPLKLNEMQTCISNCLHRLGRKENYLPALPSIPKPDSSLKRMSPSSFDRQGTTAHSSKSRPASPALPVLSIRSSSAPSPHIKAESSPFSPKRKAGVLDHESGDVPRNIRQRVDSPSDQPFRIVHLSEAVRLQLMANWQKPALPVRDLKFGESPTVLHIPAELLVLIFSFLDGPDLRRVSHVFSEWRQLVLSNDVLCKRLFQSRWRVPYFLSQVPDWRERYTAMADVSDRLAHGRGQLRNVRITDGSPVRAIAVDPVSCRIASASDTGTINVWEVSSSSDSQQIGGKSQAVLQYDHTSTFVLKKSLPRPGSTVRPVPFLRLYHSSIVCGYRDGAVICLDVDTGDWEWHLQMHQAPSAFEGMLLHENILFAFTRNAPVIDIWDVCTRQHIRCLTRHAAKKRVLCVKADGRSILSGSSDKQAILWDMETGVPGSVLSGHTGNVNDVQLGTNAVVSCSSDRTVKMWDRRTEACVVTLQEKGHRGPVTSVEWDELCRYKVISGGDDGFVCIWDVRMTGSQSGPCLARLEEPFGNAITCMAVDDEKIVTGHKDTGAISVWTFR